MNILRVKLDSILNKEVKLDQNLTKEKVRNKLDEVGSLQIETMFQNKKVAPLQFENEDALQLNIIVGYL